MIRRFQAGSTEANVFLQFRGVRHDDSVAEVVAEIIGDVRLRGDEALLANARRFDCPTLTDIHASQQEIDEAMPKAEFAFAIDHSIERVKEFHEAQLAAITASWTKEEFQSAEARREDGQPRHHVGNHRWTWNMAEKGRLGQRMTPLRSVGAYVPGGNANYPSSVIMNVVPAQVAGVNHVAVTSPANEDGTLSPAVLYAARYCGVAQVVKVGGAAAIAALAIGTESISRVDKIAGPGNRYVNEAKRQLWGTVGVDGYAGPSEVCVLADDSANAAFVAADFLTQIEHAEDNAGFLVCLSDHKADEVMEQVQEQLAGAPRKSTLRRAMADHGAVFVTRDLSEACDVVNRIAPEHLSVSVRDYDAALAKIRNAGCILLGDWSPESAGDYCAGPSHTLPTSTSARFGSPVNVLDFLKLQSLIEFDRAQFEELAPTIRAFAKMEGFPAHGNGAGIRQSGD